MNDELSAHKAVAQSEPRDGHGHFIHIESVPQPPATPQNLASKLLSEINQSTSNVKESSDDLIDVHIGNPLRKITVLLEEIKKQKAFSFTLKGSLGIAGVALALSMFGIFGGGQILCERGVQSEIGIIKTLAVKEDPPSVPLISDLLNLISAPQAHNRVVLIKNDETVISLNGKSFINNPSSLITRGYPVIVTGSYNSCSQTLKIDDPTGIQMYSK